MAAKMNLIFSTQCSHADSIKSLERLLHGFSMKYIIDDPATRRPTDFKLLIANQDNRCLFSKLLLQVWGSEV